MRTPKRRFSTLVAVTAAVTVALAALAGPALARITINGAGATFPYPLYTTWAGQYKAKTGTQINYQGIGSGGGIAAIKAGTVLFGGTDAPLNNSELKASNLVQFPMCIGGVVPVVNLPGIGAGQLKLTGPVLADIYLGKIKTWNDSRIKKLNPKLKLPSMAVGVVHRSDGSGTTFIVTSYLSRVSGSWKSAVGADKSVKWPTGVGGKGNEGVAALVKQAKGRIGYVEYAYAKQGKIAWTQLTNKSGKWVLPSLKTFTLAAESARFSAKNGFYAIIVNTGGKSWPITGATFILVKKSNKDYKTTNAMFKFFDWSYKNSTAKKSASKLNYVAIPQTVVKTIEGVWHSQVKADGKAAW